MKRILTILAILAQTLACIGATPYPLGMKSSPHGIKAPDISMHPLFKVGVPLSKAASVAQWFKKLTNQEQEGSCVAWSTKEEAEAVYQRDNNGAQIELSAQDIYQQCLVADGNFPKDDGTYGATAIKIMLTSGAMSEKTWPYSKLLNILPKMTPAMSAERLKFMALKAYAIDNNDSGYATKYCIDKIKVGVMIGSRWYNNGFNAKKVTVKTKDATGKAIKVVRYVLDYPKANPVGGHEIVIVEYDDNMVFPDGSIGGVRIHNHWSPPGQVWGDEIGGAWIPYKWAFNPHIVEDKCVIETMKPKASKAVAGIGILTTLLL